MGLASSLLSMETPDVKDIADMLFSLVFAGEERGTCQRFEFVEIDSPQREEEEEEEEKQDLHGAVGCWFTL